MDANCIKNTSVEYNILWNFIHISSQRSWGEKDLNTSWYQRSKQSIELYQNSVGTKQLDCPSRQLSTMDFKNRLLPWTDMSVQLTSTVWFSSLAGSNNLSPVFVHTPAIPSGAMTLDKVEFTTLLTLRNKCSYQRLATFCALDLVEYERTLLLSYKEKW